MGGSVFGEPMADDQIDASFIKTFIRRFFAQCQSMALALARKNHAEAEATRSSRELLNSRFASV
jgi:hypothetical protein